MLRAPNGSYLSPVRGGSGQKEQTHVPPGESYEGTIDLSGYFVFEQEGTYRGNLTLRVHPASDRSWKKGFAVTSGEFRLLVVGAQQGWKASNGVGSD